MIEVKIYDPLDRDVVISGAFDYMVTALSSDKILIPSKPPTPGDRRSSLTTF